MLESPITPGGPENHGQNATQAAGKPSIPITPGIAGPLAEFVDEYAGGLGGKKRPIGIRGALRTVAQQASLGLIPEGEIEAVVRQSTKLAAKAAVQGDIRSYAWAMKVIAALSSQDQRERFHRDDHEQRDRFHADKMRLERRRLKLAERIGTAKIPQVNINATGGVSIYIPSNERDAPPAVVEGAVIALPEQV